MVGFREDVFPREEVGTCGGLERISWVGRDCFYYFAIIAIVYVLLLLLLVLLLLFTLLGILINLSNYDFLLSSSFHSIIQNSLISPEMNS